MSPMNPRKLVPTQEPGVLDFAPGAAAAYSLRNLSLSYVGPVVTVRRSTDSAEADFTAAEVSDGTLAGWAGADGFVTQWWDQSGNARHATASGTAQPQIVDSGVLVTEGGKAAVRFDGVNDTLAAPAFVLSPTYLLSVACVFSSVTTLADEGVVYQVTPNYPASPAYASLGTNKSAASSVGTNIVSDNVGAANLGGVLDIASNCVTFLYADLTIGVPPAAIHGNGALLSDAFGARGLRGDDASLTSPIVLGRRDDGVYYHDGTISELIIYPSDQTALRQRIEGNLAWTYNA